MLSHPFFHDQSLFGHAVPGLSCVAQNLLSGNWMYNWTDGNQWRYCYPEGGQLFKAKIGIVRSWAFLFVHMKNKQFSKNVKHNCTFYRFNHTERSRLYENWQQKYPNEVVHSVPEVQIMVCRLTSNQMFWCLDRLFIKL